MNKVTLKNFFMMFLACLLVIAMMIIQIPPKDSAGERTGMLAYVIGLVIVIAVAIFVLYQTVKISNELYQSQSALTKIRKKLDDLMPKNEVRQNDNGTKPEESKA